MTTYTVDIITELEENEAMALAQFIKRVGWQEIKTNAADDNQAYLIRDAILKLQKSLRESGFNSTNRSE